MNISDVTWPGTVSEYSKAACCGEDVGSPQQAAAGLFELCLGKILYRTRYAAQASWWQ